MCDADDILHLHVISHRLSVACARHNIMRCVHLCVAADRRQFVPELGALGNMEFGKVSTGRALRMPHFALSLGAPGSMDSLFSDFFMNFRGVF